MDTESGESPNDDKALSISSPNVELLPRFRGRRPSLRSITGTVRESSSLYLAWKTGALSRPDYLTGVKGLAEHRGHLIALEQERLREIGENVERGVAEIRSQRQQAMPRHADPMFQSAEVES